MNISLNKVFLIGIVEKVTELKKVSENFTVLNFSMATKNYQQQTEWHQVTLYNSLATSLEKFLCKGLKIFVEGSLKTNKWVDNKNITRFFTIILATNVILLDKIQINKNKITLNKKVKKENVKLKKEKKINSSYFTENDLPF